MMWLTLSHLISFWNSCSSCTVTQDSNCG